MSVPYQPTMRLPALDGACAKCRAPLPKDGRFCPACGAAVAPDAPDQVSPVEAMLSEANLLRVRKEWSGAEARCLDVIRLDPNNVHAHSLLGDLYRDQGRLDHSAQWYQLAVDLDPDSAADRAKLKETEEALARDLVRAVHSSGSAHLPSGTQPLAGLPPSTWLKGLWAALAVFVIFAVILIVGARGRRNGGATTTALRLDSPEPAARKAPGPFVLPAQRAVPSRSSHTPIAPPLTGSTSSSRGSAGGAQTTPNTPAPGEGTVQAGSADSVVAGFTVDPSQSRAAVVLAERTSGGETPESLRARTVQNAYRAAASLFSANRSFDRLGVTVRAGDSGPALFAGEIERTAVDRLVDVGDYAQVLSLFTGVWWNPEIAPGPPSNQNVPAAGSPAGGETGP
jgi:RNA polymerase subunit RPABC4/transcription elongation factor Spt4